MLAETLIEQVDPVIKEFFELTPTGITLLDKTLAHDVKLFEALGYSIKAVNKNTIKWWSGDWAIMTDNCSKAAYEMLSQKIFDGHINGNSFETVASVCRRVPAHVRREDVTFWLHKRVTPYRESQQIEFLAWAAENAASDRRFVEYIKQQTGQESLEDEPENTGQNPFHQDQLHELEMEIHQLREQLTREVQRADAGWEAAEAKFEKLYSKAQVVYEYVVETEAPEEIILAQEQIRDEFAKDLS